MSAAAHTVSAPNGMISTVDQLATNAGVATMQAGGSAVDAAIAANAVLAVTTQHMCGMGGDLFAIVHDGSGPPAMLNSSGRAGSGADPESLRADGHTEVPHRGHPSAVSMPGCVDGWLTLHERYGRLDLRQVLGPAILYAEQGFPATAGLARSSKDVAFLSNHDFVDVETGSRVTRPGIARSLRAIVESGRDGYYGGEFGEALLATCAGVITETDLEASSATWVSPLVTNVWDHDLWTVPPNSQGYLALAGSAIAEQLDLPDDIRDPQWAHLMVESARAAAFDRVAVLHDGADGEALIAADRLAERAARIDPDRAIEWGDSWSGGGTMHLVAVDRDGMGVSLIQSNARGFGSWLIAGDTGIFLHNRGIGFSLDAGHPAEWLPGRRPPHTLSPAMITRPDGTLRYTLGTMGGDAQPHVVQQLVTRLLHHGQTPGEAITGGRFVLGSKDAEQMFSVWASKGEVEVVIEPWMEAAWRAGLEAKGHQVAVNPNGNHFGHAHCIEVREDGILFGRSDPREAASLAAGY